ncbi:hypothetical protein ACJX0J_022893, partial [Zea mays]
MIITLLVIEEINFKGITTRKTPKLHPITMDTKKIFQDPNLIFHHHCHNMNEISKISKNRQSTNHIILSAAAAAYSFADAANKNLMGHGRVLNHDTQNINLFADILFASSSDTIDLTQAHAHQLNNSLVRDAKAIGMQTFGVKRAYVTGGGADVFLLIGLTTLFSKKKSSPMLDEAPQRDS